MSSQVEPSIVDVSRPCNAERDIIVRAAVAMVRASQDLTRTSLSRRAGVSGAIVAKHFKCPHDLVAENSTSTELP